MKPITSPTTRLEQLKRDGYCVIEQIADDWLLTKTRNCVDKAVAALDAERRANTKAPASTAKSVKPP